METTPRTKTRNQTFLAWGIMLAASLLPNIIAQEVIGLALPWLAIKSGILIVLLTAGFVWISLKQLRPLIFMLLLIYGAEYLFVTQIGSSNWWPTALSTSAPFAGEMMGIQLQRLAVAVVVMAALLLMGYRRKQFFLARGQMNAPVIPVRWLGYSKPEPWTRFGVQWAIFITLGTLVFLVIGGQPSLAALQSALPFLPIVLLSPP
jgi:hypothetical protein